MMTHELQFIARQMQQATELPRKFT